MLRSAASLFYANLVTFVSTLWGVLKPSKDRSFARNICGFISLGPALAVVGTVLGLIVLVLVVAALAGDFFNATSDITAEFESSGLTGTAGVIAGVVAILVPIALLFALATIILKRVA